MSAFTAKIFDLETNELADISEIAETPSMTRSLSASRSFQIADIPARSSLLSDVVAGDGYANLKTGERKLIVWEDDPAVPIFHGRIGKVERQGTANSATLAITAYDGLMELGYDSDDRAGRPLRGSTTQPTAGSPYAHYDGNFINPKFASSVGGQDGISGPDLIQQVLTNSQGTDDESGPNPGEGPLPIDLTTGDFDLAVPPAVDLNAIAVMDWPVLCGDFIQQLAATGVCDVDLRPVDPSEGFDPFIMTALSAVSSFGSDKSGAVHFDWWTGSKNAAECRHIEDFSTLNNKLYDYLGPPVQGSTTRWAANLTPSLATGGFETAIAASRTRYGQFMSIRIFDTTGRESTTARPLYVASWRMELGYRILPRELLYVTPVAGSKALYTPPQDFDVGDIISINIGAELGLSLADTQRVYGYTKSWDGNRVVSISELLTSADAA